MCMQMQRWLWGVLLCAAVLVVGVVSCKQAGQGGAAVSLEKGDVAERTIEPEAVEEEIEAADNSRCHVCHLNFAMEKIAVVHAEAGIGCEKCHGSCDAHCSDEDNVTPPDVMFAAERINSFCMGCHPRKKIDQPQHKVLFVGGQEVKKVCTDCHGEHRLAHRTRRWDKTSGKLIEDDKVRMLRAMPEEEQ